MKILLAETNERTEVFRKVFDTNIFNKITANLNNKQKEVKDKLQELKINFSVICSSVDFEEKVESKDINEFYINEIIERLQKEIDKNKEEYKLSEKELKDAEKNYKKIEDELKEKNNLKLELENNKKSIDILDKNIQEVLVEEVKSQKYSENLVIIKENLKKYNDLKEQENNLKLKLQKLENIISLENDYNKNIEFYNKQEEIFKKLNLDYLEKEDEFFREQAGILAEKLEENMPCPVCGSVSHPKPALKSKSVLSKEELDLLKKSLENKLEEINILKEKITKLKSQIDILIKEIEIKQNSIKEKEQLEKDLKEISVNSIKVYNLINEKYKEISGKSINIDNFDFEKYQEEVKDLIDKIKIEINKNKTLRDEKEKDYLTKLKNLENIDFDNLKENLNLKKKEFEIKKGINIKLKIQFENNKKAYEKLEKISKNLIDTIKTFNILDELYRTASGNLPGKPKINFEQYIQTNYFDMVVQEANKRFMKMTDSRFQLIRKESSYKISDKIALELEVIDYYNGKKRDVKSLSGGEAFKASLCLALGLSDIIQNYSGGVQVETLFIDEGFGSLDSESREQAIDTLNQLADGNKLIGIISHVSELQERIDKKIIVEKGINGSRIIY